MAYPVWKHLEHMKLLSVTIPFRIAYCVSNVVYFRLPNGKWDHAFM